MKSLTYRLVSSSNIPNQSSVESACVSARSSPSLTPVVVPVLSVRTTGFDGSLSVAQVEALATWNHLSGAPERSPAPRSQRIDSCASPVDRHQVPTPCPRKLWRFDAGKPDAAELA